jgi:hypothetical protein
MPVQRIEKNKDDPHGSCSRRHATKACQSREGFDKAGCRGKKLVALRETVVRQELVGETAGLANKNQPGCRIPRIDMPLEIAIEAPGRGEREPKCA